MVEMSASEDPLLSLDPKEVRRWEWTPSILPLSADRRPFAANSSRAIESYARFLRAFPEAYGRLGRFVRAKLGTDQPCPLRFVFREGHIDVNESNERLADLLLAKGFEPDHFLTLNPAEYTKCFTMRFEIPSDKVERSHLISSYLRIAMEEAEREVNANPGLFAYSEIECYSHKTKRTFSFKPVSREGTANFPFPASEFVPSKSKDYKKCDIHVKVPVQEKGVRFESAADPEMLVLRQLFLSAGFYEIRSLSGNIIYTIR
jgi:hypothetical protein